MVDAIEVLEARDAAQTGRARRLREAAGLTQSDVARHLGVMPSTISRWEGGHASPVGAQAAAWARLLRDLAAYIAQPSQTSDEVTRN